MPEVGTWHLALGTWALGTWQVASGRGALPAIVHSILDWKASRPLSHRVGLSAKMAERPNKRQRSTTYPEDGSFAAHGDSNTTYVPTKYTSTIHISLLLIHTIHLDFLLYARHLSSVYYLI